MHDHHHGGSGKATIDTEGRRILLVGNPNVGKSVIFHSLSGKYATVSNYPGTTVEVTRGQTHIGDQAWEIIDTPGIQSLLPNSDDERVARDILLDGNDAVVVQVADAKNLRRSLVITSQLAELGFPMLMALNMWDEAEKRGIQVDTETLSQNLGVAVVETIAVEDQGISGLREACAHARPSSFLIAFDPAIEDGIRRISTYLPPSRTNPRGLALLLMSGDRAIGPQMGDRQSASAISGILQEVQSQYADPLSYV
ncbi:MAG: FeoB small GTPase domain-containing protein, partial [Dehalococcoidia bacterium]|nr:FeoB small GTPase domain-containing protein [Dehalococcoidia bacterium]